MNFNLFNKYRYINIPWGNIVHIYKKYNILKYYNIYKLYTLYNDYIANEKYVHVCLQIRYHIHNKK